MKSSELLEDLKSMGKIARKPTVNKAKHTESKKHQVEFEDLYFNSIGMLAFDDEYADQAVDLRKKYDAFAKAKREFDAKLKKAGHI